MSKNKNKAEQQMQDKAVSVVIKQLAEAYKAAPYQVEIQVEKHNDYEWYCRVFWNPALVENGNVDPSGDTKRIYAEYVWTRSREVEIKVKAWQGRKDVPRSLDLYRGSDNWKYNMAATLDLTKKLGFFSDHFGADAKTMKFFSTQILEKEMYTKKKALDDKINSLFPNLHDHEII